MGYKHWDESETKYKTVKRVILRDFKMPSCCRECDYEGNSPYSHNPDLPVDTVSLPLDDNLPFCIINAENISDDTVRATHCPLKEVDVLEKTVDSLTDNHNEVEESPLTINVEFNIDLPEALCDILEDHMMDVAFEKAVSEAIKNHKMHGRTILRVDPKTKKTYEEV